MVVVTVEVLNRQQKGVGLTFTSFLLCCIVLGLFDIGNRDVAFDWPWDLFVTIVTVGEMRSSIVYSFVSSFLRTSPSFSRPVSMGRYRYCQS